MISNNSFAAASALADNIDSKSKVARPLGGTPLETLTLAKSPLGFVDTANVAEGQPIEPTNDCCDTEEHKQALSMVTQLSVAAVRVSLHTAKNIVNPMIKEMVEKYEANVHATVALSNNNLLIKSSFYHDIWSNPVILSMVENYDGAAIRRLPLNVKFPSKTSEELRDFIKTGVDRFDKELMDYLDKTSNNYGFDLLLDVYQTVFSIEGTKGISNLDDVINPYVGSKEAGLITLLLATKLNSAIPDGMNVPLEEYRSYVTGIIEQAGRAVARSIEKRAIDIKNKQLIINYPSTPFGNIYTTSMIEVNGKVYNQWLEEGGCPEALFGAYIADQERGYSNLLANKDQYVKVWEREKKIIDSKVRIEMHNIKVSALRKAFFDTIAGMSDETRTATNVDMVKRIEHIIENLDSHRLDDIYHLARMLICRAAFPNSQAEMILRTIDEVAAANPDLAPNEAALLASIDYVSSWVASQIKCDKF